MVMDTTVETKEDFIAAASSGLPRVADAIIATPPEARIGVIDAVMESYRKLAGEFLGEEETEKWLSARSWNRNLKQVTCVKERSPVVDRVVSERLAQDQSSHLWPPGTGLAAFRSAVAHHLNHYQYAPKASNATSPNSLGPKCIHRTDRRNLPPRRIN